MLQFTKLNVDGAPEEHGVYALLAYGELIYFGQASGKNVTIRSRLQRHYSGTEGPCTKSATHFEYLVTPYPLTKETELLRAYKERHRRLPRCNERIG
jgi:hypothetical protein